MRSRRPFVACAAMHRRAVASRKPDLLTKSNLYEYYALQFIYTYLYLHKIYVLFIITL